jgi:hypothetical protein
MMVKPGRGQYKYADGGSTFRQNVGTHPRVCHGPEEQTANNSTLQVEKEDSYETSV